METTRPVRVHARELLGDLPHAVAERGGEEQDLKLIVRRPSLGDVLQNLDGIVAEAVGHHLVRLVEDYDAHVPGVGRRNSDGVSA